MREFQVPLLKSLVDNRVDKAMLKATREGFPKRQVESWDINELGGA